MEWWVTRTWHGLNKACGLCEHLLPLLFLSLMKSFTSFYCTLWNVGHVICSYPAGFQRSVAFSFSHLCAPAVFAGKSGQGSGGEGRRHVHPGWSYWEWKEGTVESRRKRDALWRQESKQLFYNCSWCSALWLNNEMPPVFTLRSTLL